MNELNGKWTISRYEEDFYEYEYFDTRQEAVQFGKAYEEFEGEGFYIGRVESIEMRANSLGDVCIEHIGQVHYENDGEYAEEYLTDVEVKHVQELDKLIEKVVLDWATKHDYHPKHFFVQNIEFIEM